MTTLYFITQDERDLFLCGLAILLIAHARIVSFFFLLIEDNEIVCLLHILNFLFDNNTVTPI